MVNLKVIRDGEIKDIDTKLEVLPITTRDATPLINSSNLKIKKKIFRDFFNSIINYLSTEFFNM